MKKTLLSIIALTAFSLNAQNIFREDFSTYTVGSQLSGQSTWSNQTPIGLGSSSNNAKVVANTMNYTNYGSCVNAVELKIDSDACGRTFTPVSSGDLYVSFVMNLTNAPGATATDFFRVYNGNSLVVCFRMYASVATNAFFLSIEKGSSSKVTTPLSYSYNQDHLIVLKYTTSPGTNDDLVSLFVDPIFVSGEPATASAVTNNGTDASGNINGLFLRQNNSSTPARLPTGKLSLLSTSTTWAGLSFLPLANEQFTKSTFEINANQANQGLLNIKSSINLENANVNIYDIQGRMIENKKIALTENNNEIAINPISNSGIYILEIVSGDKKIAQKIAVK